MKAHDLNSAEFDIDRRGTMGCVRIVENLADALRFCVSRAELANGAVKA